MDFHESCFISLDQFENPHLFPCHSAIEKVIADIDNTKAKKLKKYKDLGKTTVLLIESNDIALMDIQGWKILNAIRAAYPFGLPIGINEIWY